jgi:hypothetical protein
MCLIYKMNYTHVFYKTEFVLIFLFQKGAFGKCILCLPKRLMSLERQIIVTRIPDLVASYGFRMGPTLAEL